MNFVINLNKPKGITSHQAVENVRRISGIKKAGHAGTLDPLATGVLLVCTGEATKITRFLSDLDKEYIAEVKLGEKTDTYDAEGEVTEKIEGFSLRREDIERILPGFTGTIEQIPPMYSAVKMGGKPLYKLARKGLTVEREKRVVTVHDIRITGFEMPFVELRVSCSKGTYVRSLCNDIGDALGVGAHITGLVRTRIGGFNVEDSVTLDELENLLRKCHAEPASPAGRLVSASVETLKRPMKQVQGKVQGDIKDIKGVLPSIHSIDSALRHLGELRLTEGDFSRARNGIPIRCSDSSFQDGEYILLKDPSGSLFAIGKAADRAIKIERMLHI